MRFYNSITKKKISIFFFILIVIFAGSFSYYVPNASAALMTNSSVQFSDSRPSATGVSYITGFTFPTTTPIECVQVKFATTSGMGTPATGMTSGSGFTLTGGGLTQGNWTNFGSTNGTLEIFAASGQTPSATAATITWTGVTNSSITNPSNIYAQITTFSTESSSGASCTGQIDQSTVMAEVLTTGVSASVSVDPSLTFAVANDGSAVNGSGDSSPVTTTSTTIPFGTVAAGSTAWGSQTLTTATNADHGYSVYVRYSGQMTDANADTFRDQSGTPGSPASYDGSSTQSSFGYTADGPGVTFGSNQWAGLTTTNAQIATRTSPQTGDAFHVEYKVEPSNTQAPGTYTTTIVYTATPTY
jgi:hypothetical protein